MKRFPLLLLFIVSTALRTRGEVATAEPARVDLVEFGDVKAWPAGDAGQALQRGSNSWTAVQEQGSGRDARFNFGVEWDEPREFSEVRFATKQPITRDTVRVEYWVSAWPALPGGGWTHTDTPWVGEWRVIHTETANEAGGGIWRVKFAPLSEEENPNAKNQPGYAPRFRFAMKLRLRFNLPEAPEISRFEVVGVSRWNTREVTLESRLNGKKIAAVSATLYNGRIKRAEKNGNAQRLFVSYLEHAPGSNDATILRLRAGELAFGVSIDDVIRNKGIYVADAGVFVGDAASGTNFANWMAEGRLRPGSDILSQVAKHEEQSLERAMAGIPALSMTGRTGRHPNRYIPLGMFASREKYGLDYNGNIFVSKHGSKLFAEELARMKWAADEISFRFGTGVVPDFRERERAARQSVLDNYLPAVRTDWENEGIEYEQEAFSTLPGSKLDFWNIRGDELSALLVRLTARNKSASRKRSALWLNVTPNERLSLRGTHLLATGDANGEYAGPRLRAIVRTTGGDLRIVNHGMDSGSDFPAARWQIEIGPGDSADLFCVFTFRTVEDEGTMQKLDALDYGAERERVIAFWKTAVNQGMRLEVPDDILNHFYKAALEHVLVSVYRDLSTGLYMAPCGTYDYNMFANETDMQVRFLDMRGLHEMAARFVEPMIALQGSKALPGRFRDKSAMLHGVKVDEAHDYTHSGYNLNHGWTLWTLSEHYLFTRDRAWLESKLPGIRKAAEWIISERSATMNLDAMGRRVWEYGLLPAGQLEDNEEWQYWFAVNAYAYRGLKTAGEVVQEVDVAEGERLQKEAAKYREDLRAAVFRSMAESPVQPLHDGSWVPAIGTRTHAHGRDVGWIRNILYGPQVLLDCGVIGVNESAATWILEDLEDNLFMSPESFSVLEQEWFDRGGITLQPSLVNTTTTYLERDNVRGALRAFYNAFAVSFYPDVNAFTEWAPSFGRGGGPFFKTSDESGSLAWLRQLLVRESGETLYLASGAPQKWFRDGARISIEGASTYLGPIDLTIESHVADGFVDATVNIPEQFRGQKVLLRLRHPQGKQISRVEMENKLWAGFEAAPGWIDIPVTPGRKHLRAYF